MSLSSQEQLEKFIRNSKEILILIPENPSADSVGAAWAFYYFLEKIGLAPSLSFRGTISSKLEFLPRPKRWLKEISGARDFVLSFDTSRNKIISLRQEEKDGQFNIFVTPEKGTVDPRDFSFILAKFKYDLVIVIGSPDLDSLGELYFQNTDLFFEVPVVNIDCQGKNDNFGQINLVDITASSACEIIGRFLEERFPEALDDKISTCLLTGLIGATDSFQRKNTSPKTLSSAAALMDKGANQTEIIRWLYKTHPLRILKLWGRAMSKINWAPESRLVWAQIELEDFVQSRSTPEDLPVILEKLKENYDEADFFLISFQKSPGVVISLLTASAEEKMEKISALLGKKPAGEILKIESDKLEEVGPSLARKIQAAKIS